MTTPPALKMPARIGIWPRMGLRLLLAIFIGVAMVFAPLGVGGASAQAMAPSAGHHGQTMGSDHCNDQSSTAGLDHEVDKSCCVAMCAAVVVPATASVAVPHFSRSVERPSPAGFDPGFLAELPTPPPRLT